MTRFFILCLLGSWLTACASLSAADAEKADLHLRMGTSLLSNGHYPQALAELLEAEKLNPKSAVIQNNLGLAYYQRGRAELAIPHIRKALELDPKYTDAKNTLGRILIDVEKYDEADRYLREATEDLTYSTPEKPLSNLGLSYFRQKKFAAAKTELLKALEIQRNTCDGQTLYGRTLFELKEFQTAAAVLDRAIGVCPNNIADEPQYYSALAYYEAGDQRKAEVRLEEITKIYPNGHFRDRASSMLQTMRK